MKSVQQLLRECPDAESGCYADIKTLVEAAQRDAIESVAQRVEELGKAFQDVKPSVVAKIIRGMKP